MEGETEVFFRTDESTAADVAALALVDLAPASTDLALGPEASSTALESRNRRVLTAEEEANVVCAFTMESSPVGVADKLELMDSAGVGEGVGVMERVGVTDCVGVVDGAGETGWMGEMGWVGEVD